MPKPKPSPKPTDAARALMTLREVAELDRCSEKTVRRAIAAGLLKVVRPGPGERLVRIDPAEHALYRQRVCG